MREARHACCGASHVGRSRARARRRTWALPMPASSSGWRDARLGRGAHARAVVAEVVEVGAVGERAAAALRGGAPHPGDQLALAEVAALARVAGERRLVELARLRDDVPHAQPGGETPGDLELLGQVRRGDGREGDHAVRPEGARGGGQHHARVDAAGEGDAHRAQRRQPGLEPCKRGVVAGHGGRRSIRRGRRRTRRRRPARHPDPERYSSYSTSAVTLGVSPHTGQVGAARHFDLAEAHRGAVELHEPVVERDVPRR